MSNGWFGWTLLAKARLSLGLVPLTIGTGLGGVMVRVQIFVAALGVVLSGCANDQQSIVIAPPPPVALSATVPVLPTPGPWRITKTEWTRADEEGFGGFVRAIAQSACSTTISCMQTAANFYHDSDSASFLFRADCAKWSYMLRAYYASKNGLPFSYVSMIAGDGSDLRFTQTSNRALMRTDIVDSGTGIDTDAVLQQLHDKVWTATYRMDPESQTPVAQDFYSPKIQPGSIRAGTAIYDINGHVMIVYDVGPDGGILYMDAHPDETVTRGTYGVHVPKSPARLGGGFKNFRPLKLEGATLSPDGSYVGGYIVPAQNEQIADFSLEQYLGNAPTADGDDPAKQFRYNNVALDLYEYARASMSNGAFAFNPVYELEVSMGSLCRDAQDGTRKAKERVRNGLATLYSDLSNDVALWQQRDLRVVYHGISLKQTLNETYAAQQRACRLTTSADSEPPENPLDKFVQRSPETDPQRLIAQINDHAPFSGMRPVGY
jgi:hypothetical protein